MAERNQNSRAMHGQFNSDRSRLAPADPGAAATTESLAAAVEAELAKAEAQLAAISRSTDEARPYEAFDFLAFHSAADAAPTAFEYDGHCPLISIQPRTPRSKMALSDSLTAASTDSSSASAAHDVALANRVRVIEDAPSGAAAHGVAAEMEVAFRQLARLFSGDVAQQWQSAAGQLDEARAMVDELRQILATARMALTDISNLREDAQRARGACNPACRKS